MLIRTELTEGSTRTRSFSFREIVRGFKSTSIEALQISASGTSTLHTESCVHIHVRHLDLGLVVPFYDL